MRRMIDLCDPCEQQGMSRLASGYYYDEAGNRVAVCKGCAKVAREKGAQVNLLSLVSEQFFTDIKDGLVLDEAE